MRLVLIDFRHPFFRPMTRRIVIVTLMAAWTVFEFVAGSDGWGVFFGALTAYVGWGFFISGQPDEPEAAPGDSDGPEPPASQ
jgi:hypothetical protein